MPVKQITRGVTIDGLFVSVSAWRWTCDNCGHRETFPDNPMPEGRSESDATRSGGWHLRWREPEGCVCSGCWTLAQTKATPQPPGEERG